MAGTLLALFIYGDVVFPHAADDTVTPMGGSIALLIEFYLHF